MSSFFARSTARAPTANQQPTHPNTNRQSPTQTRRNVPEEERLTNLPEIEDVMDEIRQGWDFMTTEQFNAVHLALALLDGSSLGKDHYAFGILFGKLQKALDGLVNVHYQGFNNSITTFSGVVDNINDSKARIQKIKSDLLRCKELLQAKRSDLLELFKKSLQYREMMRILDLIEDLKKTPEKVDALVQGKYFLGAVRVLLNARKTLHGRDLKDMTALSDLRRWLEEEKKSIHENIIEELHNHLYLKSSHCEDRWKAYLSADDDDEASFFILGYDGQTTARLGDTEAASVEALKGPHQRRVIGARLPESSQKGVGNMTSRDNLEPVIEDLEINPEEDSFYYLEILLESVGEMDMLPETMEAIQQRLPIELYQLVDRTIAEVDARRSNDAIFGFTENNRRSLDAFTLEKSDHAFTEIAATDLSGIDHYQNEVLRDLIWTLYSKLNAVMQGHRFVLDMADRICKRRRGNSSAFYSFKEVWLSVQSEVKSLLYDYLTDSSRTSVSFSNPIASVNEVLRDHKQLRDRNKQIFKFSDSEAASSMAKLYKPLEEKFKDLLKTGNSSHANPFSALEGNATSLSSSGTGGAVFSPSASVVVDRFANVNVATGHRLLVKPDGYNVSIVFRPTVSLIAKVEELMPDGMGKASDFNAFLDDFILNIFLPQIEDNVLQIFYQATSGIDAFQVDPNYQRLSTRPLLKSSTACLLLVQRLCKTLHGIPFHREEYIRMIEMVLNKYYEKCLSRYRLLVAINPISEDESESSNENCVLSAQWSYEPEIVKLLLQNSFLNDATYADLSFNEQLSKQEIQIEAKMKKERSLHISDLIFERKKLTLLGNIQHSLKWLVGKVWQLRNRDVDELPQLSKTARSISAASLSNDAMSSMKWSTESLPIAAKGHLGDEEIGLSLSGDMAKRFDTVLNNFQKLAETCLFTLRIEFRCHCMYYMDLATREGNYFLDEEPYEPDPYIFALNSDLVACEEAMTESLPKNEIRFVFDGLAALMVQNLISNVRYVKRLNRHGVTKMARNTLALQQNLTNIAGAAGEAGLERVRQYYELFNLGPENFMTHLRDQGLQFTFEQYKSILDLIYEPSSLGSKLNEAAAANYKRMYADDLKALMDSIISKH